jgi:PAS domain S-box-containing protein
LISMISVLCVDDDTDFLDVCRKYMEKTGLYTISSAESAQIALEMIKIMPFDAIVSDYLMPGMDGIEFLKRVRTTDKNVPFIMLTGHSHEEIVIEALNNGANFYLQKGGNPKILFQELMHVIRQSVLMRQALMALAEQEQRYHDLQNANDLIQSVAPDGHFLFVNKKWLDTLGYQEHELPNLTIFDIIHEESLKHCMEIFQQVISGENVGIIDAVFKTRDGVRVYVEGMANCKMVDGKPQYTRGIFKNVTKRKEAEAALKESVERYHNLLDNLPDYIFVYSKDSPVYVNTAAVQSLGYTKEELLTPSMTRVIAADSHEIIKKAMEQPKTGLSAKPYEIEVLAKDGTTRTCLVRGSRIIFNTTPSSLIVLTDITDRKLAEELVRESENKFATVFQNSPIALILVSATDEIFVDVNDAFVRNTGYSREEAIGKTSEALGIFADMNEYMRFVFSLRDQGTVHDMELSCRIKTGEIRNCRFSSSLILIGGKPYIFSAILDITERKAWESAFQVMVRSMVGTTGLDSLQNITQNVSSWLGAECVIVGEIQPDKQTVKVLSMLLDGKEVHDFSYPLNGTPCGNVAEKGFCFYSDNATMLFPESKDLTKLNIRGYIGTPLRNSGGEVIGILCALFRSPIKTSPEVREIINIIAVKAAAEIERKQIEQVLSDESTKYKILIEHSRDGIVILDQNGKVYDSNRRFAQMLGYSFPEIKELYVWDWDTQIERAQLLEMIRTIDEAGDHFETQHLCRDGTKLDVEISTNATVFGGKKLIFCVVRDITDRKRAEEALRESQQNLSAAMDLANLVSWEFDVPSGVFTFNDRFYAMYCTTAEREGGYRMPAEVYAREFVLPEETSVIADEVQNVIIAPDPDYTKQIEHRIIRRDGEIRYIVVRIAITKDAEGRTIKIHGANQDITERKLTEEALHRSEERYRSLLEHVPDLILVHREGLIVYTNSSAVKTLGYEPSDALHRRVTDFIAPEFHDRVLAAMRMRIGDNPVEPYELDIISRDGKRRTMIANGSEIEFEGEPASMIVLVDITEQKALRNAVQQANKKLKLLSSITRHDILNQLAVINGYLDLLHEEVTDDVLEHYFTQITRGSSRINAIIQFNQAYEQIGVRAPVWKEVRTLVNEAAQGIVWGQVSLENDLSPGTCILADPMILTVLSNLMDNAIRHGETITTIRFSSEEREGTLIIVCEDDGVGIPDAEKDLIFKRGYGKNIGLGLFLGREILAITGIVIRETGEAGKGARFEITVPHGAYRVLENS